ncbi:MAG: hypothetical protein K8R23_15800 [Chthoniobacter sp.]|nr:hypothetical protein [Chthoniobacter sp.]
MRLTKDEIVLVVAVLLVFVGGAAVRHYRQRHPPAKAASEPAPEPNGKRN